MITRIYGTVTGGRLNLRAAAASSASILVSIPNENLLVIIEHNDAWYAAYLFSVKYLKNRLNVSFCILLQFIRCGVTR